MGSAMKKGLCLLLVLLQLLCFGSTAYASAMEVPDTLPEEETTAEETPVETPAGAEDATESTQPTEPIPPVENNPEESTVPPEKTEVPAETEQPVEPGEKVVSEQEKAEEAMEDCTCGTDDDFHAVTCPRYVMPEKSVCTCAKPCWETGNPWCDICGNYGTEQCQGEEEPEAYEASGAYTVVIPASISVDCNTMAAGYSIVAEGFDLPDTGYVTVTATSAGWLSSSTSRVPFTNTLSGYCLRSTGDTLTGLLRVQKPQKSGTYAGTITFLIRYYSGS